MTCCNNTTPRHLRTDHAYSIIRVLTAQPPWRCRAGQDARTWTGVVATHVDGTFWAGTPSPLSTRECFLADGFHLRRAGRLAYAALPRTGLRVRS